MNELMKILTDVRPDLDYEGIDTLIDDGILDSFDIIAIVSDINDTFDVEINVADLLPENFNSAAAIMSLINRLKEDA